MGVWIGVASLFYTALIPIEAGDLCILHSFTFL